MAAEGFDTAERVGLGRACFSGRILSMFAEKDKKKIANFILGASLQIDIAAARNSGAIKIDRDTTVIVSGKDPLRRAIYDILEHIEYFSDIKTFTPDEKEPLSGVGARLVAEKSHIF